MGNSIEAITTLHQSNFFAIRDSLTKLGEIKIVLCNYSQYSSRYDAYKNNHAIAPAFDPKLSGGALMDINIYNVNLSRLKRRVLVHEFIDFGEIFERGDYSAVEKNLKISLNVMTVVEQASCF